MANIRNYAVHSVPEHAFAMILALRRNMIAYRDDVLHGAWQKSKQFCFFDHPIRDLHGAVLGIIGEGAIGQSMAMLGKAFGMRAIYAAHPAQLDIPGEFVPLSDLLAESDVITLHLPLMPATRNLIGEAQLRSMKPTALLINTARGGLVDEAALIRALEEGWIGGAGFDVLTVEPPTGGHPLLEVRRPNFILTPHIAWASHGAMQFLADQLMDNIDAWAAGRPQNLVTDLLKKRTCRWHAGSDSDPRRAASASGCSRARPSPNTPGRAVRRSAAHRIQTGPGQRLAAGALLPEQDRRAVE